MKTTRNIAKRKILSTLTPFSPNFLRGFLVYRYNIYTQFIYPHNLYSMIIRLDDMQNLREMMVNYDWLSKEFLDEFFV
jgi:hypothetical protein